MWIREKSHRAEIGVLSAHHQMLEQNSKWNAGQKIFSSRSCGICDELEGKI